MVNVNWVELCGASPEHSPTLPTSPSDATNTAATYLLNPQDKLIFNIDEDPSKTGEPEVISVNAIGEATFRITRGSDLAINLMVRGKTLEAVKKELKEKLDKEYYQNASVRLELKETSPRYGQVLFIGKGSRGNMLQLVPGEEKRIFEAVFQVGVNEFANLKKVKLTRVDQTTQKTTTQIIDLEEIKKGVRTNNVILQNGDIIDVPERGFVIY